MSRKHLEGILVEDDASKFLGALPDEQRRPQYIKNKLAKSPESYSDKELEAALSIFSPKKKKKNKASK